MTFLHFLESESKDTVREAPSHQLLGEEQGRAACGAVVVHVVDLEEHVTKIK